ncbi:zinc ribbon domain-containing protein [Cellulomonas chengniuliangii]|uniref:Zinc ribbon domain-containing protein n=1 Tax=Cellulomonas chengniuliangii TaxID=2968084 RepID=A0ABY5L2E1_9CELL|nr:zinc ribbon domain-containing protein [Cellulomonas chengniuliangii]MCC2307189.1 zinc ribbon domain-containing protein [Cellulomonas chengniuliangii]UUI76014.1 zinc ribbon domain-containing protein [Cellulomonas chengniuliangii]
MPDLPSGQDLESLYTLRAEDLSADELERWTGVVPGDESILRRLMGPGPKLLKGPRGSGKSNYLKRAFYRLQERDNVLVTYINYSQHLALEPLMLRSERAIEHFRQWLIYKIIIALNETLGEDSPPDLAQLAGAGIAYINELQTSIGQAPRTSAPTIAPADLLARIEGWCEQLGKARAVLLMDDAAHAFMHQQQREFFEVFRALRSRTVACKAAIYPGVTSYSPFFNVGHEAEEIEVWIRPDSPDYLDAMQSIFRARFPESLQSTVRPDLVAMAAHASFGLPRNFLNILSDSVGISDDDDEAESISAPTLPRLRDAVRTNADRVRSLFGEVANKLPRYENFVSVGAEVYNAMIGEIRETNHQRPRGGPRYIGVALAQPWDADLTQVFSLLEYAGLIRRIGVVSRGRDRYEKIQVHTSLLIADNALSLGRNPSAEEANKALARQSADDFVRRQPERLFTADRANKCSLNLSPCPKCGSPRVSDDAVFCFKCGTALTEQSVYIELLASPIDRLNLPPLKLERILELTNIKSVQDIMLDDGGGQLRTVKSIGKTWSARIKARAEEYVTL